MSAENLPPQIRGESPYDGILQISESGDITRFWLVRAGKSGGDCVGYINTSILEINSGVSEAIFLLLSELAKVKVIKDKIAEDLDERLRQN